MLGGELQPAARHHVEPADLARDRGDAGGAQPFFDRPQDEIVARRPDQDEARRIEPQREQTGTVEIGAREAPQHDPVPLLRGEPPEKKRSESGGKRPILLVAAGAQDLVHGAAREAAGQGAVDGGEPQGHRPVARRRAAFDLPHPLAQGSEGFSRSQHACSFFVLILFDVKPEPAVNCRRA